MKKYSFTKFSDLFKQTRGNAPLVFLAIILIISAIFILFNLYKPQVYKTLDGLHLIPHDETFTELYFVNRPTTSPEMIVPNKKIEFSFAIHNLEGKETNYPYQVYFKEVSGKTKLIDNRTVTLKDGETRIIKETRTVERAGQIGNIVVYLKSSDQEIHFMMPSREFLPEAK